MLCVYEVCFLGCYGPIEGRMIEVDTHINVLSDEEGRHAVEAVERHWKRKSPNCADDAPINTNRGIKLISLKRLCCAEYVDDYVTYLPSLHNSIA